MEKKRIEESLAFGFFSPFNGNISFRQSISMFLECVCELKCESPNLRKTRLFSFQCTYKMFFIPNLNATHSAIVFIFCVCLHSILPFLSLVFARLRCNSFSFISLSNGFLHRCTSKMFHSSELFAANWIFFSVKFHSKAPSFLSLIFCVFVSRLAVFQSLSNN